MNFFFKLICFSSIALPSSSLFALDRNKCAKMVNEGWFKKYDYNGPYFHGATAMTDATKKDGFFVAYTDVTNQGATAALDTGYSSNLTTAQSQSSTSTGDCSLFAKYIRVERIKGILANNLNEVKVDIANGGGDYTKAIAEISLCKVGGEEKVSTLLRNRYSNIFAQPKQIAERISETIDTELSQESACPLADNRS